MPWLELILNIEAIRVAENTHTQVLFVEMIYIYLLVYLVKNNLQEISETFYL